MTTPIVWCQAGHRTGLKCSHKRNDGKGGVYCDIDATSEVCIYAHKMETVIV